MNFCPNQGFEQLHSQSRFQPTIVLDCKKVFEFSIEYLAFNLKGMLMNLERKLKKIMFFIWLLFSKQIFDQIPQKKITFSKPCIQLKKLLFCIKTHFTHNIHLEW